MQTEKGIVEWNGGVKYSVNTHTSLALVGITIKDIKKHNADIALKYLKQNMLNISNT